jgi:hypothetical protein
MFRQFDKKPYAAGIYSAFVALLHKLVHSICAQAKYPDSTET